MALSQSTKDDKGDKADLAKKIEESDDLKLKMVAALEKPDPEDALYPPELNAHLIEQLRIMTCENNELRKLVYTRDQELGESSKVIKDLNQRIRDILSGTGPAISSKSAGVISVKIAALCKNNRHLVAEIEAFKTKNAALERKIMQLELMNESNKDPEKLDVCCCKEGPIDVNPDELKELNHKLASVTKKLYESKNKNMELKNDILMATKILQQELGDKFTCIKDLQHDLAGWKGRSQQIIMLQSKISDLEEKLNGKKDDKPVDPKKLDQASFLKNLEIKKKKEFEESLRHLDAIKAENQELKKKLDAAKCRTRNLECDVLTTRQKMQTFAEKSNHDDQLINEQRNQIKSVELYYQDVLADNTRKINCMKAEIIDYQKLIKNADDKVDALRKQATEKAVKIEELRKQLLRYEECSLQSVFFSPMKTATDNEIRQLGALVNTLNGRLDAERHKYEELEANHRKIKERKKRLEKKFLALEEELKLAKETRRPSKLSKVISKVSSKVSIQGSDDKSLTKKQSSSISTILEKTATGLSESESNESLEKDELKYRLELANEKLNMLEDKLKMVEEEKQEDINNLTEMIQTSKQLFNEALCVLQKEKCVCN